MVSAILAKLRHINVSDVRDALNDVLREPRYWAIAATTLACWYVVNFYWQTMKYPAGPRPLPLVGNILMFRSKDHSFMVVDRLRNKFGSVFTFFLGSQPNVVITDLATAQKCFNLKDFSGRPQFGFGKSPTRSLAVIKLTNLSTAEQFLGPAGKDVILSDYSRQWEVLRRVAYAAVRKYAANDALPGMVAGVVDEVMEVIKKKHGDEPFDCLDYIYLMTYNILAQVGN